MGERERDTHINRLPFAQSPSGTWPTTQACIWAGDQTGDLSVHSTYFIYKTLTLDGRTHHVLLQTDPRQSPASRLDREKGPPRPGGS